MPLLQFIFNKYISFFFINIIYIYIGSEGNEMNIQKHKIIKDFLYLGKISEYTKKLEELEK